MSNETENNNKPLDDEATTDDSPREKEDAKAASHVKTLKPIQRRAGWKHWVALLIITLVVGAIDQVSKQWAHNDLRKNYRGRKVVIDKVFNLSYVRNPGAAWGILSKSSPSFRKPFFRIVSVLAMLFILYFFYRLDPQQKMLAVALALVMGGAVGNFIDRIHYDYVIDFLDFRFGRFKWPTFNVADIAISVGVGLLFLDMILNGIKQRRLSKASGPNDPP